MSPAADHAQRLRIIVDTREQEPWGFSSRCDAERAKLVSGDYSVAGYEGRVAVERKSLADFVGTLVAGRARFFRELRRLATHERACVVVEASLEDLFSHRYQSTISPRTLLGAAAQISADLGIPVYWCHDRGHAREFVEAWLRHAVAYCQRLGGSRSSSSPRAS